MKMAAVCFALALAGCSSEGICTDMAFATGNGTTLSFGQCWDSQDREVECTPSSPGHYQCVCSVAGNLGATFERTEPLVTSTPPRAEDLAPINAGCGWSLRPR